MRLMLKADEKQSSGDVALGLALVVAVFAVYSPVWWAGFIWDDDAYVTANPVVTGPLGFLEIWTTKAADVGPLTITTFWLEHKLWGLNPLGFHIVNVVFHGLNAVVFWRLLRQLEITGAWMGAALWALHPVLVESVAWIAELKNTQATLFYLASLLFFARWLKSADATERKFDWNYLLALIFAALAMASKSSTVILPLVFCLCAWWVEQRWRWRSMAAAAPVLLFSLLSSALSLWTQGVRDAGQFQRGWLERLIGAGDAIWFYLGKLVWPYPLLTVYPRWNLDAGDVFEYLPLLAVALVLAIFWWRRNTWGRPWFFVLAYFVTTLLPVLGLIQHGFLRYSLVSDHFQNLASMGPLTLVGAAFATRSDSGKSYYRVGPFGILLLTLGVLSWQQAWDYQSEETLWAHTLEINPLAWVGQNNMGNALFRRGAVDEAIDRYRKSIQINPSYDEAHSDLGLALLQKGDINNAIAECQRGVELNPNFALAHNNLGDALSKQGRTVEASAEFKKAIELNPYYAQAQFNFSNTLFQQGRLDEAITGY
jgi:tetratricopeptide (TPR) repeat protein